MEKETKKKAQVFPVLRDYFKATTEYPWIFGLCFVATIALQGANVLAPLYLKEFIDLIAQGNPSDEVVQSLVVILATFGGISLAGWAIHRVQTICVSNIESRVMANLTNSAFSYLIRHSHDFFISNFVGSLTRKVSRYARAYEQVFDSVMMNFLPTLLFASGVIFILYSRNVWLGHALLAWTIFSIFLQLWLSGFVQKYRLQRAAEDTKLTGALSDVVGNHSSVSLFAAEKREEGTFGAIVDSWRAATLKSWNIDQWMWASQGLFAIFVEVALLVGAVFAWQAGYLTVGDFVLIQIYVIGLIDRLWGIGQNMRRLYEAFADASEMIDIFNTPHAVDDAKDAKELVISSGSVSLSSVGFWFSKDRPIFSDLSLAIAGGEKVAFVGPSGAGKSTITKLLLRLYDPKTGAVLIDDQDIKSVTQKSLREAIAFVPQEPALFHRTLRENIGYGRQDATLEEIIEAAKSAHCHEFIATLPDGYDTHVGERGVKLSGGERQRVAIARAILKNAPILVLDEATSSLDSESESLIQDALRVLMEGKTVIVIAHRLSTIMRMDRIVVIEKGKVVASGTHDKLLSQEGSLYQKLWNIQAGGFITEE